jgi:hypothetical protein
MHAVSLSSYRAVSTVTFAAFKMDLDSRKKSECGRDEAVHRMGTRDDAVITICRQRRSMRRSSASILTSVHVIVSTPSVVV